MMNRPLLVDALSAFLLPVTSRSAKDRIVPPERVNRFRPFTAQSSWDSRIFVSASRTPHNLSPGE